MNERPANAAPGVIGDGRSGLHLLAGASCGDHRKNTVPQFQTPEATWPEPHLAKEGMTCADRNEDVPACFCGHREVRVFCVFNQSGVDPAIARPAGVQCPAMRLSRVSAERPSIRNGRSQ